MYELYAVYLFASLTFGHPLSSNLDPWLAESFDHVIGVHTHQSSNFARIGLRSHMFTLGLVISSFGLELDSSKCHDTSGQHVAIKLLLLRKSKYIESIFSVFQLFIVVNRVDLGLSLRDIDVVVDARQM